MGMVTQLSERTESLWIMHLERANLTVCDFYLKKAVIIWKNIGIVDVDFLQLSSLSLEPLVNRSSKDSRDSDDWYHQSEQTLEIPSWMFFKLLIPSQHSKKWTQSQSVWVSDVNGQGPSYEHSLCVESLK